MTDEWVKCSCCSELYRQWDLTGILQKCRQCWEACPVGAGSSHYPDLHCCRGVSDDDFETYRKKILEDHDAP